MNFYKVNLIGNFLNCSKYQHSMHHIYCYSLDSQNAKDECKTNMHVIVEHLKMTINHNNKLIMRKSETSIPSIGFISLAQHKPREALFEGKFQQINLTELKKEKPELFI